MNAYTNIYYVWLLYECVSLETPVVCPPASSLGSTHSGPHRGGTRGGTYSGRKGPQRTTSLKTVAYIRGAGGGSAAGNLMYAKRT